MNLSGLVKRLKVCLSESELPQFWSDDELVEYINEANIEFVKFSQILTRFTNLDIAKEDNNAWFLPDDMISVKNVYYHGKPIFLIRTQYISSVYSGVSHQQGTTGSGVRFIRDWRGIVSEPTNWYTESGLLRLFPRREADEHGDIPRRTLSTVLLGGSSVASLSGKIPYADKSLVDVFVNGVYQNFNTWNIVGNPMNPDYSAIAFTWSADEDMEYDIYVTYQVSDIVAAKYSASVIDEQTEVEFPNCTFEEGKDFAKVVLNGVTLFDEEYIVEEKTQGTVTVTLSSPAFEGLIELIVYRKQDGGRRFNRLKDNNVSIEYYNLPLPLVNDSDEPEYPAVYHPAIYKYAAWLALSREGEKTQDFVKARYYLESFERDVAKALHDNSEPIVIDYDLAAPFVL